MSRKCLYKGELQFNGIVIDSSDCVEEAGGDAGGRGEGEGDGRGDDEDEDDVVFVVWRNLGEVEAENGWRKELDGEREVKGCKMGGGNNGTTEVGVREDRCLK